MWQKAYWTAYENTSQNNNQQILQADCWAEDIFLLDS
jgi:hypothetical protein